MREHCYIQQFSIVLQKNKIDFLGKSVKNLLSWIIGRMQGIFFNLVLLLVKTNNILKVWVSNLIFLECFCGTCFCNSPRFHISSLAMCIVWLLICYFYFSNKADKFCFSFFLDYYLHFVIYLRMLPIANNSGFKRNEVCHDIKNNFIKNQYLLTYFRLRKNLSPVEFGYGPLD